MSKDKMNSSRHNKVSINSPKRRNFSMTNIKKGKSVRKHMQKDLQK